MVLGVNTRQGLAESEGQDHRRGGGGATCRAALAGAPREECAVTGTAVSSACVQPCQPDPLISGHLQYLPKINIAAYFVTVYRTFIPSRM